MKFALLLAAMLVAAAPAFAYESKLPKGSVLCGSRASMDEAEKAIAREDAQWFKSLPLCMLTNQPVKAQRIDCSGATCKVRFWVGGESAVGYTFRRSLSN